ncbi:MAG: 4-alpha-glucanotransferase, partial [Thermoguttaceae bacterium]|nr:4-alpha-glucanotransferase [Thermoguttaceae bacterium]
MSIRSCGVLLPVFSLPGTVFLGGLGRFARRFADDLADMRQTWWQLLPINPVDDCHSPYSSRSAFAGETLYIDLEDLYQQGLLDASDLEEHWFASDNFPSGKYADYEAALKSRFVCWQKAFERFQRHLGGAKFRERQEAFQAKNQDWLEDTVLFQALSEHFRTADWSRWPTEIRRRF